MKLDEKKVEVTKKLEGQGLELIPKVTIQDGKATVGIETKAAPTLDPHGPAKSSLKDAPNANMKIITTPQTKLTKAEAAKAIKSEESYKAAILKMGESKEKPKQVVQAKKPDSSKKE